VAAEVIQLRPKHPSPTRVPTSVVNLVTGLRGERGRDASVEQCTHPTQLGAFRQVRLQDTDVSLVVPSSFNPSTDDLPRAVRKILSPALVKTYLATWTLAQDKRGSGGAFRWSDKRVAEVLGLELYPRDDGGRRLSSFHRGEMHRHLATLGRIYVVSGDGTPEPLIKRTSSPERVYDFAHAPTLWSKTAGRKSEKFLQAPFSLLQRPAADVPLALGLALVWRSNISTAVLSGGGVYKTTLAELAVAVGEDPAAGLRRLRRQYWPTLAERLQRVAYASLLGRVTVTGEGPEAVVELTPSGDLVLAYMGLVRAAEKKRAVAHEVEIWSGVAAQTPKRAASRAQRRRP
jgi:hypothetical protein